uniref:Uncharacterized protein n=1 Tax=Poecilia latipinna TaxID=48699 RepID=A0A3B3VX30_9TELE
KFANHERTPCGNGECIDYQLTCDGVAHCKDKSDEKMQYCGKITITCAPGLFSCPGSYACVPKRWLCDGERDCPDGSDELSPAGNSLLCNGSFFMCSNGRCISQGNLCDGKDDCGDGSDERNCNVNECLNRRVSGCTQDCQDLTVGYKVSQQRTCNTVDSHQPRLVRFSSFSTSMRTFSSSICGLNREISRKAVKAITPDKKRIYSWCRAADTSTLKLFFRFALVTELVTEVRLNL